MRREEVFAYISEQYGVVPEYPWARTPNNAVLRHAHNRKWFAAILDVPRDRLGLEGKGRVDALNLKCDPVLADALRNKPGILPAYHMNKDHWISVLLDGTLPDEAICGLITVSYGLTK